LTIQLLRAPRVRTRAVLASLAPSIDLDRLMMMYSERARLKDATPQPT
jgi:hypothetical protein